jgi:hypothetical protein
MSNLRSSTTMRLVDARRSLAILVSRKDSDLSHEGPSRKTYSAVGTSNWATTICKE